LVVQSFGSGEVERPVLRNDHRIAQVVLQHEAAVIQREIDGVRRSWSPAGKADDRATDAKGDRFAVDDHAGDIGGCRS
jgi:hypothetical protein